MSMKLDIEVFEAIASRRAIAFVGSGPSCEMKYPSWGELCNKVLNALVPDRLSEGYIDAKKAIDNHKYPEALGFIESIVASREKLCTCIGKSLKAGSTGTDELYKVLAELPFSCYLTTNYDDELKRHLDRCGRSGFGVLKNTKVDFYSFRDEMKDIVFKIHGDMDSPSDAVITSRDYSEFASSGDRSYFRARLQMLFGMKRCIIIGYSLADRDLSFILEGLKQKCSVLSPSYIFLPNPTQVDITDYDQRYGIKVIPYKSTGADHSKLVSRLKTYSKFISRREGSLMRASEDSKRAAELYMFRLLNKEANSLDLMNYVLLLVSENGGEGTTVRKISKDGGINDKVHLENVLNQLVKKGLVHRQGEKYNRTKIGDEQVLAAQSAFDSEKDMAFRDFLKKISIMPDQIDLTRNLLQECLAHIFESRGDALVNSIFGKSSYTNGALIDIYSAVAPYAAQFESQDMRAAFFHGIYDFIVSPTSHQKTYLVALAQGYFLYHMMKRDSKQMQLIDERLRKTVWYVDSNLLIQLVAVGSTHNKFAVELFNNLKRLNVRMIVLPSVLAEVRHHLKWAEEHNPDDSRNYYISISETNKQQNLFVDGYIRSSGKGGMNSFSRYVNSINLLLDKNAEKLFDAYGLCFENPRKTYSWDDKKFMEIRTVLEDRRKRNYSFRRDFQVETDAELLYAMQCHIKKNANCGNGEEVCFLSQSHLFDEEATQFRTWSGEAMFRFVQFAIPKMSSEESLHECLQNELYNVGVKFIDEERYKRFFREEIDWAELTFKQQKADFMKFLSEPDEMTLTAKFNALPDLDKPIFINQMIEKQKMIDAKKIRDLGENLDTALRENSMLRGNQEQQEQRIKELEEELRKKSATVLTQGNELRNLRSGKKIRELLKQRRPKRRKRRKQ